jgi:hypothetical protein
MDSYQGRYSLPACMHATSSPVPTLQRETQHGHEIVCSLRGSISEKAGLECKGLGMVKHCDKMKFIE